MRWPRAVIVLGALCCVLSCADEQVAIGAATNPELLAAARLAIEHAAEQGTAPDTMFLAESTSRPSAAIRIAQRFVAAPDLIAVVAHSNSAASLAASQVYNRNHIVQIAPHSSAAIYSMAGPYSFRLVPPDDEQGGFLARQIERTYPPGTSLALLWVNDDYGRGLRRALVQALDTTRYPVVLDLPHAEGPDFGDDPSLLMSRLERTRPDVIVWLARAATLAVLLPRIRASAGNVPILGPDALSPLPRFTPDSTRLRGIRHADFLDPDGTPALRRFGARFRREVGREATAADALTYDAVALLAAAVAAGARSGEGVRDYLESLGRTRPPFDGITGEIAFDAQGDVRRSYVMQTLTPRLN